MLHPVSTVKQLGAALPPGGASSSREADGQLGAQYVVEAKVLAKPSIFQRYCYSATWMPWPFPTTDILIRSQGYDLGEVSL